YDRVALQALADALAAGPASPTPARAPSPEVERAEEATLQAQGPAPPPPAPAPGLDCARRAAGLDPEAAPVYLKEASFQGTPAYVAAFRQQAQAEQRLLVVAVARETCRELARVQRKL
ncbi:MAG TPA: hypothetical protein VNO34_03490, partial [Actinomycetota bacterium]|nr:hypothetical protein [Actinomycetota bacterium]